MKAQDVGDVIGLQRMQIVREAEFQCGHTEDVLVCQETALNLLTLSFQGLLLVAVVDVHLNQLIQEARQHFELSVLETEVFEDASLERHKFEVLLVQIGHYFGELQEVVDELGEFLLSFLIG